MIELPIPAKDPHSPANPFWVQLLTNSLEFLWDGVIDPVQTVPEGRRKYVCYCLTLAFIGLTAGMTDEEDQYLSMEVQLEELKQEITQKLGHTFYEDFLLSRLPLKLDNDYYLSIQAARLRWVRQLIEEFGG